MEKDDRLAKYYGVDLSKIDSDREITNVQIEELALMLSEIRRDCNPKMTLIFGSLAAGCLLANFFLFPSLIFLFSFAVLSVATFLSNEDRIQINHACRRLENEISDRQISIDKLNEIELEAKFRILDEKEKEEKG